MEYQVYWLLKSSCFEFFGDWKYGLFRVKKLMEIWYLLITEKFLFWTFLGMKNTVFFKSKSWWKDYIYWLLKSSRFELFGDGKYGLFRVKKLMEIWYLLITEKFLFWTFRWWEIRSFFSQKVDGNMIFTWLFLAFHNTPGFGKDDFSCSVITAHLISFKLFSIYLG